eukprot:5842563-Pyramimonas_sp.AAC.1
MAERLIVNVKGEVCAQRWLWIEDFRAWLPMTAPVAFEGEWPEFPDVISFKRVLLKTYSAFHGLDARVEDRDLQDRDEELDG